MVLVSAVGSAAGSRAAAATLACAGSEPDRAGLMVDLSGARPLRPSLVASTAARALEERLSAHLPEHGVASRGRTCHLTLPASADGLGRIPAALSLVRDSVGVVHLPPFLVQPALERNGFDPATAMLRADVDAERPLTALAVSDLIERGVSVSVLKRGLGWVSARLGLAGIHSAAIPGGLPDALTRRLLGEAIGLDSPDFPAPDGESHR